jgi:hypothetical protein
VIFVYFYSTWGIVEVKMHFETWITRNDVIGGVCLTFLLITLKAYLCSQGTPNVQMMYFMFDWSIFSPFVLNRSGKPSSNNDIRTWLLDMRHSWTKNACSAVNINKWYKWWKFVSPFLPNNTYGLLLLKKDTKSPNQVFYVRLIDQQTICAK